MRKQTMKINGHNTNVSKMQENYVDSVIISMIDGEEHTYDTDSF